ncbi:CHY zinc finger domain containing protein [Nitzschia inconspicua]|uniref:CHY zinc finger domain containing protein n=1 Tax=Nitzschia inconspicua TaxID=303405 RepID=A0A9K3PNC4_9STRA|nr:CHY zinc finger domain containing protein [Nitzschia inconspicua]KAG7353066.1 CHY zinc finger domain containing protein [Nitzschia inconspicua]
MADTEDYMDDEDMDMEDSDDELEGDDGVDDDDDDDDDGDDMNEEEAAAPPEPVEEEAAIARRRAIQAIMRDNTLSDQEKRMQIQNLMSRNRTEVAPPPTPVLPQPDNTSCVHYERNCRVVAPCCGRVFGCRICHDELSPPGHTPMNRFMIREVVCKQCGTRQAASNQCINCKVVFGEYHCGLCNLWMSMSKKPFHCSQCGFCRVGGAEAFRHCNECCMCISISVFDTHQCFKDKYKNNCPVCREDMFSSRQSPQDLPCGHAIHAHCFRKLAGFDYRCPICKKTVVSQQSMAAAWEARARDIAEHPMPGDLQRIVDIMCNDCETKSPSRNWHFLGIQCPSCSSFNTVVEQVLSSGPVGDQANNQSNNPSTSGSA